MALHFTKQQIDEIEQALIARSKKDSSFPGADALDGTELIPIIQGGVNKVTTYSGLWNAVSKDLRQYVEDALDSKVDVEDGKQLSTEDYTTEDKSKLSHIEAGAQVNVNSDWNATTGDAYIVNKPDLSIYATKASLQDITALIPTQASITNQLADKTFVNSTVATNTAEFKGTYNTLSELETVAANKNDYGFVISVDSVGNTQYDRYKYTGTSWLYEYSLNNSSFTASQWEAIQSGITAALVEKLSALPTNESLQNTLLTKVDKVNGKGLSTNDYTTAEKTKLAGVAEGAQVNVLEGVQINGTDLPIAGKKVNLPECIEATKYQTNTDDEFVYRQTGGGLDIDVNNARISSIKGKTLAWNQVASGYRVWGSNGPVISDKTNNGFTATAAASSTEKSIMQANAFSLAEHLYYLGFDYISNLAYKVQDMALGDIAIPATSSFAHYSKVAKRAFQGYSTMYWYLYKTTSETWTLVVKNYLIVDLTLMYGSGNEPTVEEFEKDFGGAYPTNAGTLISNDASSIETVGFNQWDEEWEKSSIDSSGLNINSTTRIRSKNYIPVKGGIDYYSKSSAGSNFDTFFYDANKVNIGHLTWGVTNVVFTTPSNCAYMRIALNGTTYNHDICINLSDPAKNGTYEPYRKSVMQLNLGSFQVRDSQGNVTTITGGLKSAGSVYDEIIGNKYIKRVGSVDLGSLSWNVVASYGDGHFAALVGSYVFSGRVANSMTSKYVYGEYYLTDKVFTLVVNENTGATFIGISDSSYTDATAFNTAMSGVMLNYELVTPIEYELVDKINYDYKVDRLGTERVISDTVPTPPFRADIKYREANVSIDDIYNIPEWSKKDTKPEYSVSEISGMDDTVIPVISESIAKLQLEIDSLKLLLADYSLKVRADTVDVLEYRLSGIPAVLQSSASGAPSEANIPDNWDEETMLAWNGTPRYVGQVYVDKVNKKVYYSVGTNNSTSDWVLLN